MGGMARAGTYLIALALLVATGLFFVTSVKLVKTLVIINESKPENALWMGGRLAIALRDFEKAALQYELNPTEENLQKLSVKLDLYWSATSVFHSTAGRIFRKTYESQQNVFIEINQGLDYLDFLLGRMKDMPDESLAEIKQVIERSLPQVDQIRRYILQVEASEVNRLRQLQEERVYILFWQFVCWVCLLLVLAAILYRKYQLHAIQAKILGETRDRFIALSTDMPFGLSMTTPDGQDVIRTKGYRDLGGVGEVRKEDSLLSDAQFNLYDYPNGHVAIGHDVRLEDGSLMHFRIDMSDLNKKVEEIQLALMNHESATEAKSDFMATMSHEMRTPLNGVLGLLGLLLDGELEAEQRGYVLTARESAEVLLHLIEDILDYSKIEAGKLEIESTDFSVSELVGGVCDMLAPKAYEKGIEIGWDIDPAVPANLRGDPGRLRQILLNLAGNAVKFTERGGVAVEMALASDQGGDIFLSGQISDTGIGIPYESQDSMFGEFNQLDASFSRRFGGSGLGLAITRRLVEAMGGSIRVSSEPDHGSVFSFSVKMKKTQEMNLPIQRSQVADKLKLLLWSVEGLYADLLLRSLRNMGHEVVMAQTDNELLALVSKSQVDVVLLDCKIGDDTGKNFARKLYDVNKDIELIVLHATKNAELDQELLAGGFVKSFIQKPINPLQLSQLLTGDGALASQPVMTEKDIDEGLIGDGYRLLLVEDSPTNRMVASVLLRRAGYKVDWVIDGVEAVEAVQKLSYDLVLMDISMPNMDGEEATKIIRNLGGAHTKLPIIALTAHAMPGDQERFLAAGMNGYLTKPLEAKKMLEMIQFYLPRKITATLGENLYLQTKAIAEKDRNRMMESLPLIDMTVIEQMTEDAGEEAIPMLIEVFKSEVPMRVEGIKSNLASRNFIELARDAHTLKSSSGSFGAMRLNRLALEIETAAKASNSEAVQNLVINLDSISEKTLSSYDSVLR
ncbi:response regulator [Curvivirga aplysinae]|uniref:response regulator n=1 Tax=Curvivirga aplysinae TaxID=2529852 RepID=UPI0012BB7505|nr:response regulator [Curvivirga aplysinae]MTI10727.1 response regulator [Curvivirga aplysinae]